MILWNFPKPWVEFSKTLGGVFSAPLPSPSLERVSPVSPSSLGRVLICPPPLPLKGESAYLTLFTLKTILSKFPSTLNLAALKLFEIFISINIQTAYLNTQHRDHQIFLGSEMNLYSKAIGWLAALLAWPHYGIVLDNTQFEFLGISINVPRIF